MKFLLVVLLTMFCFCAFTAISYSQNATSTPVSVAEFSGSREQDGLRGPVRRVRVEIVNIVTRDGKLVELPRALREVSTYNAMGRKTDSVAYPVEGATAPGKEEYQYDKQGNIIEMTLRGNDGSVLSKEKYNYEFDEFGNWKKMTTAVAVYENGAITYEPIEVTYRTLTNYYGPPIPTASTRSTTASRNAQRSAETEPKPVVDTPAPSQPAEVVSGQPVKTPEKSDAPAASSEPDPPKENTKPPVLRVSEQALRKAAMELPQPEYPAEARLAGIAGQVQVQLIIDEKGTVNTVRPTSGNPILFDAVTTAASKARFSMSALSDRPTSAYGVLTYDFAQPAEVTSNIVKPPSAINEMRAEKTTRAESHATVAPPAAAETTRPVPQPSTVNSEAAATAKPLSFAAYFDKGMASLASAKYEDAVESFTQAITLNPGDAVAHAKLGVAYSALAANKLAIAAFKQAIKLNRAFVDLDSYYRLGSSYIALSDYRSAVEPLKQALYGFRAQQLEGRANPPTAPSETEINQALGLAYYGTGSYRQALKAFEIAVRLKPDFASAHYGLGLSYLEVGDKSSAEKEEQILRRLKSPLADRMTGMLLIPAGQRNKVF
jgi:TonB family protein